MKILGITGGMGMGKSTVSSIFRRYGFPVYDADAAVHNLQKPHGKALPLIAKKIPLAIKNDEFDRSYVRKLIAEKPEYICVMENIMLPLIAKERNLFLGCCRARGIAWCVLDVPLLFEKNINRICDKTLVVSAPPSIQKWRILQRNKVTWAQAQRFIKCQMPDIQKRKLADIVIKTGLSRWETFRQVKRVIDKMKAET